MVQIFIENLISKLPRLTSKEDKDFMPPFQIP